MLEWWNWCWLGGTKLKLKAQQVVRCDRYDKCPMVHSLQACNPHPFGTVKEDTYGVAKECCVSGWMYITTNVVYSEGKEIWYGGTRKYFE